MRVALMVLAERGAWAFVAFQTTAPIETSLLHGLDATHDPDTDTSGATPQRPASYCGWFEASGVQPRR